jgi:hypothetical protein
VIAPRLFRRFLVVALSLFVAAAVAGAQRAPARIWPDTSSRIVVLADQFGRTLSPAQERFVATHFAGWHNAAGERAAAIGDGKILMNISDAGFRAYWAASIATQVTAGDYDGVFFDSASPALLQFACSGAGERPAGTAADARLAGTAARDTAFAELGGRTWIRAWEEWVTELAAQLNSGPRPIALIPNVDGLVTGWDNTNYGLASGIFAEGFADPGWPVEDWRDTTCLRPMTSRGGGTTWRTICS